MPTFRSKITREFFDHWSSLRSSEEVPALSAYLAHPNPRVQPHTAILDVLNSGLMRVRLLATKLVELAGIDLTGGNLLHFVHTDKLRTQLWHASQAVTTLPCGLLSTKVGLSGTGRKTSVEMLSLPLIPFAGSAPVIACAIDVIEAFDYRERVFGLIDYLSADWIDLGSGTPETHVTELAVDRPSAVGEQS